MCAQPTPYTRQADFSDYQASAPSDPLVGSDADLEFDSVKQTLDEILTNLAVIQRDDTALANSSVHKDAFDADALALIGGSAGWTPRGDWTTATSYSAKDLVRQGSTTYVAVEDHTSGTFSTDKNNGKWLALFTNKVRVDSADDTAEFLADKLVEGAGVTITKKTSGSTKTLEFSSASENLFANDAGAADAYVVTFDPAPSGYTAGMVVRFRAANTNTGASTIDVNELGAAGIKRNHDGTDLQAGDIQANSIYELVYDGTNFRVDVLADGVVDASKLAADAVNGDKIADDSIDSEHYAADSIDSEHYAPGSVDAAAIGTGEVGTDQIAAGAVDTAELAADAVTGPKIAADAVDSEHYAANSIDAEHYAPGSVDAAAIGAGEVGESEIATNAVHQAEISTSTGSVSGEGLFTLPGGQYGFYPRVKHSDGSPAVMAARIAAESSGTSFVSRIYLEETTSATGNPEADQRYVDSSPPYDFGDGEIQGCIYVLMRSDLPVAAYVAPTPPWIYNGPTDARTITIDKSGRKFRQVKRAAKLTKLLRDGKISLAEAKERAMSPEYQGFDLELITHAMKNADMDLIPHPFGSRKPDDTVVLLNPMDELVRRFLEAQEEGESIGGLILTRRLIRPDNEPLNRRGPPGVMQVRIKS